MNDLASSDQNDPLVPLAEEFADRYRRGERPAPAEYADKHPELAERINRLFPALVVMEEFGSVAGPPTGPLARTVADRKKAPQQLGEYRILREVARGGMGVVYEAVQESLGRHVALKVLPGHSLLSPTHLERFRREARAAAKLHHTNIVPVFGVGEHEGIHFYAMQFIHGQSLDSVLYELRQLRGKKDSPRTPCSSSSDSGLVGEGGKCHSEMSASLAGGLLTGQFPDQAESQLAASPFKNGGSKPSLPLPAERKGVSGESTSSGSTTKTLGNRSELTTQPEAQYFRSVAQVGMQVGDALAYAHHQGILHRDIKPSNLLLDTQGTVWVTDFGLAKAEGTEELTSQGDIVGTLRYMAPERFQGHADPRSDVYSLGLTLYEMLTLCPAFSARCTMSRRRRASSTAASRATWKPSS